LDFWSAAARRCWGRWSPYPKIKSGVEPPHSKAKAAYLRSIFR
jgi:hypothetical protein